MALAIRYTRISMQIGLKIGLAAVVNLLKKNNYLSSKLDGAGRMNNSGDDVVTKDKSQYRFTQQETNGGV